jgi:hypothetical protein
MSSKQINFFAVPEDLQQFEIFFKQREIYTIKLPVYNPEDFLSQDDISLMANEKEWEKVYLTKKSFLENIVIKKIEEQNYLFDEEKSNVLEFDRPQPDPFTHLMKGSRFYYITSYFDSTGKKKDKDPEFVAWADKLVKEFKKEFLIKEKADKYNYYTKGILNTMENGLIEKKISLPAYFTFRDQ